MGSLFNNLGIRKRFAILLRIFTLGFAFFWLWSFTTLNEWQVNGPLFQFVVKNKELVADGPARAFYATVFDVPIPVLNHSAGLVRA
jgi:hypothetical protein